MSNNLPKLKTDFWLNSHSSCIDRKLNDIEIDWYNDKSLCIVLCSKGYPDKYKKNVEIKILNKFFKKKSIFISCRNKIKENKILSNGGRVLNIVTKSKNLKMQEIIFKYFKEIKLDNGYYRKDIAYKVIKE